MTLNVIDKIPEELESSFTDTYGQQDLNIVNLNDSDDTSFSGDDSPREALPIYSVTLGDYTGHGFQVANTVVDTGAAPAYIKPSIARRIRAEFFLMVMHRIVGASTTTTSGWARFRLKIGAFERPMAAYVFDNDSFRYNLLIHHNWSKHCQAFPNWPNNSWSLTHPITQAVACLYAQTLPGSSRPSFPIAAYFDEAPPPYVNADRSGTHLSKTLSVHELNVHADEPACRRRILVQSDLAPQPTHFIQRQGVWTTLTSDDLPWPFTAPRTPAPPYTLASRSTATLTSLVSSHSSMPSLKTVLSTEGQDGS